jgi:hypothetical protein
MPLITCGDSALGSPRKALLRPEQPRELSIEGGDGGGRALDRVVPPSDPCGRQGSGGLQAGAAAAGGGSAALCAHLAVLLGSLR